MGLPMTTPSREAQFWDDLLFKQKQDMFVAELKKPYSSSRISLLRSQMDFSEPMFTLIKDNLCKITVETIRNIPVHWIQYEGSSINNGLIIAIHGGGYVAGMPQMQYSLCSELSKLTGCVCVSIDYRICPGTPNNPITITDSLNDCFSIYKYMILNKHIPSSKICIIGESAGGGLSCLLLQKIRDYNKTSTVKSVKCVKTQFSAFWDMGFSSDSDNDSDNNRDKVFIGNPACCWVNSPWTNLEMNSESTIKNSGIDAMLVNDPNKYFQRMAIGQIDINLNKINATLSLKDKRWSPLFGEWNDLCPIYFMCAASEMLVDDTLQAAKKAVDHGVEVQVDIEPFMHHTFPLFLRTLPEAKHAVIRASDFIIKHLKVC